MVKIGRDKQQVLAGRMDWFEEIEERKVYDF
jgi:hypothetical protein